MPRWLDVALIPSEALLVEADLYVVIDQLRATTTIATLFAAGLRQLTAMDDMAAARAHAGERGALLFGEVGGLPPPGFDYGNSPAEAAALGVAGREAVLFTSNGTKALCALGERGRVITGALANLSAVVRAAAGHERVLLVCSGNEMGQRFALEDAAVAAALTSRFAALAPGLHLGDGSRLLVGALPEGSALLSQATSSHHARGLVRAGFAADVSFAARVDTSAAVPGAVACGPGFALLRDARAEG